MFKMVWGEDQMPIYICEWHILKVWHLHLMEKVKNNGVQHAIFDDLYTIMYTSQIYKLYGFVPNSCKIYYFISLYWLNMNVMHYLNMKVVCTIFMCKQHE
jgi:hypothetical protein